MTKKELYQRLDKIQSELSNLEKKIRTDKKFKKVPAKMRNIIGDIEKIFPILLPRMWSAELRRKIAKLKKK